MQPDGQREKMREGTTNLLIQDSRSLAAARTLSIRRHDALRFLLAQWLS